MLPAYIQMLIVCMKLLVYTYSYCGTHVFTVVGQKNARRRHVFDSNVIATATTAINPGTADAVHLVHEDCAGCMLPAYM